MEGQLSYGRSEGLYLEILKNRPACRDVREMILRPRRFCTSLLTPLRQAI